MLTHEQTILHALSSRRSTLRTSGLTLGLVVVLGAWQFPRPTDDAFVAHLEEMLPALLHMTDVPGAAIALIEDGEVINLLGFGSADGDGKPIRPATVFNVGSISKSVTAWGIMRLVEDGVLDLDGPVSRYLPGWRPAGDFDLESITIRRLLSHTAGLSMPSVPEYGAADERPSLSNAVLGEASAIELTASPGAAYQYSGGGYMVLQLVIERVTGKVFADYMTSEVLRPLGMTSSGFGWTTDLLARAATPFDGDRQPVEYFSYTGAAAASLEASLEDMARFAAASLLPADGASDPGVLRPSSVQLLLTPAANTEQRFGITYGLGYSSWPAGPNRSAVGHNGQNTGWAAALWLLPDAGRGLIVLTNHSAGSGVWQWVLCDWVTRYTGVVWRGLCGNRPEGLPAAPVFLDAD